MPDMYMYILLAAKQVVIVYCVLHWTPTQRNRKNKAMQMYDY